MNALGDMIDSAMRAVRSLKRRNPSAANELRAAVLEMKAAIKEADGE
jgi:hypothetical protein